MFKQRILSIVISTFLSLLFPMFPIFGVISVSATQREFEGRMGPGGNNEVTMRDQYVRWRWHFLGKSAQVPNSQCLPKFHIWLDNLREVRNSLFDLSNENN